MGVGHQLNSSNTDICWQCKPGDKAYAGEVKWFNEQKGFGFITCKELSEDVFVHYSTIISPGFKTLKAGQLVELCVTRLARGLQTCKLVIKES
jgi:CspA family cold shock protein